MYRTLLVALVVGSIALTGCRRAASEFVTVALPEKFTTLDTLTSTASDAAAERLRTIIFNTLVKKNERFEYVGELAKEIQISADGKTLIFRLQDNVKFHNGRSFTSADVKYTFDELFKSGSFKSKAFFDSVPVDKTEASKSPTGTSAATRPADPEKKKDVPHIVSIETPDAGTVIFTVTRTALANQLLSNLVAIPIIPEGSVGQQKEQPIGTGPYRFVSFDASQNIVELVSNHDYWEGPPSVEKLRVKTVTDANSLQAELQIGAIDIAPNPSNLPPDSIRSLSGDPNLYVEQTEGSNIQYLVFNTQTVPLDNKKVRQAIGYSVDRAKIVSDLLFDQARPADSILPPRSWAFATGAQYRFDPERAKVLLKEAGYQNEPIVFKYSSGNSYVNNYAQVLLNSLTSVGLNVSIETLEVNTIREQLAKGQFQMFTGVWIGGNQDPIFLRDLFASSKIPGPNVSCCNRSRYVNSEIDKLVEEAINTTDRERAQQLYVRVWEIVSDDLPLLPLWYPANIVIANKRIGNIKISPSGDYSFVKAITLKQ